MTDETVRFLHDLKLPRMAGCWTSLEETHQLDKISLRDGMQLMLQHERDMRTSNHIARLIKQLKLVHLEGRETNFFCKLSAHDLLIIDDRYNRKALILASQLPIKDWYNVFKSELIAEACLDRIVHKSKRFELKGESLRKKY